LKSQIASPKMGIQIMMELDTISAIATPIGQGAIAIIRISGPEAICVAQRLFVPFQKRVDSTEFRFQSNRAYFGKIIRHQEVIDEVVLTVFRAPKSYTREDLVEISCHGGLVVAKKVLTATLQSGARPASPGEFTKRAFLNGRIDLTQAEAVADLIGATSETARKAAVQQLQGSLKRVVVRLRDELLNCLAHLEASIDFPEEGLSSESINIIRSRINTITATLEDIIDSTENARGVKDGFRTVLVGLPNVGKSSLLNALLSRNRAIVSAIPGTTRDTIEELIEIEGLSFRLIDTAGLRDSAEGVEEEGIARTRQACEAADIVFVIVEAGRPMESAEVALAASLSAKMALLVVNKIDLADNHIVDLHAGLPTCFVSSKSGQGISSLKHLLVKQVRQGVEMKSSLDFLANARQEDALRRAATCIKRCRDGLTNGASDELTAEDIRIAIKTLSEVIGDVTTDQILDIIFSKFCIGK